MADNIKIVGNILNTTTVTRYTDEDINLIPSSQLQENFGGRNDYIESYVYDAGGNLLNTNYNYLSYKLPSDSGLTPGVNTLPDTRGRIQTTDVGIDSTLATPTSSLYPIIEIDPVKDLQDLGYSSGEFNIRYNFFNNQLSNYIDEALFVKEISADRTEIRLASTTLTNDEIEQTVNSFISTSTTASYQVDYLLNFGNNEQYLAVNVALNKATTGYEVLFKLYQPLPLSVQEKQTLWIVQEKVVPYVFDINLDKLITPPPPLTLRGPNFDIPVENQGTISTAYNTYEGLVTNLQSLQNNSYTKLLNLLATQSVDINIDYTDFDNFVFFGSAKQRVINFYNKVKQIEDYNTLITTYTPQTSSIPSLITEINQYTTNINTIVSQFDGYESYLYFESSSYSWPKSGSLKPFVLYPSTSDSASLWYNSTTGSAEDYDDNNYDNLQYAVPAFIRDDQNNQPFLLFLNMVGHYFDNIWIYLKSVTDINLANNNLEQGISKDLVYDHLRSLGVRLYNSQAGESVDQYLIGANTGSSIWDNDFTITGSYLNNVPRKDLVSELYKRIYHNLPLLLKTKGTVTGLEHLITTFGITGSILNVKEYGGGTKAGLIRGYDNEKVRVVANTITGSVLSSELSLQTFPTASSEFRDEDTHYIDISFSPETQIDTYISGAIASYNPTWVLDDYIGDPRQQYSASYIDLDAQRKLYFETGVPGFAPFTASLLDYNGFIRLIEYFDNSLFKMLADFVPERASLSTGVTINSPVLERNKAVYSVLNMNTQSVHTGEISASTISPQYGKLYNDLQGDKSPFFTGELSGSVVDVNQYFEDDFNPYDGDWDVYNSQHNISQSINLNTFLHSDWNVLLNNVSKSVESNIRKHIEYVWGTTGSITSSAELQDSYLTLRSYQISRYEGSKVTSLLYNTYTSASYTGSDGLTVVTGDNSFGKTAAIDHNSYKLAWLKTIPTQSLNFNDKTSLSLKYLVDSNSNVTELNSNNNNVVDVQNIFQSGDNTVLSITNPGQKKFDGTKLIWKGGYSFSPIIYRENGESMTFVYDNYLYSSSLNLGFLGTDKNIYSYVGAPGWWPAQPIKNINDENFFRINGLISSTTSTGATTLADKVIPSSEWIGKYGNIPKLGYISGIFSTRTRNGSTFRLNNIFNINNFTTPQYIGSTLVSGFFNEPATTSLKNTVYKVPRSGTYGINGGISFKLFVNDRDAGGWSAFKLALVIEKTNENGYLNDNWNLIDTVTPTNSIATIVTLPGCVNAAFESSTHSMFVDPEGVIVLQLRLPGLSYSLTAGDYIRFSFYFIDMQDVWGATGNAVNMELSNAYWGVIDTVNTNTQYIYQSSYTSSVPFFTLGTTYQTNDTLNFNTSASAYFYSSSFSGSSSNYSPIVDKMSIQPLDIIKFGTFNAPSIYYEVIKVTDIGTGGYPSYKVVVSETIIADAVQAYNNFAILRPKPDETSVILEGRNAIVTGIEEIPQSLLVPIDASETLKASIGNIAKSLNTTLQ